MVIGKAAAENNYSLIGSEVVAQSAADAYTLMTSSPELGTLIEADVRH